MTKLTLEFSRFGENEREIWKYLDLDVLTDYAVWHKILFERNEISEPLYSIIRTVRRAQDAISTIHALLRVDHGIISDPTPGTISRDGAFSVIIRDVGVSSLTAMELSRIMSCMQNLYNAICEIEGVEQSELLVIATDSGSNKSFDFSGMSKVIGQLKNLLIELWDRRRLSDDSLSPTRLKAIQEGINLLDRVTKSVDSGALKPEDGERLRRAVMDNAVKLLRSDVVPVEAMNRTIPTVSELPQERRALLEYTPVQSDKGTSSSTAIRKPRSGKTRGKRKGNGNEGEAT